MLYWGSDYEDQLQDLCKVDPAESNMSSSDLSNYILPYEKITKNNLIAGQNGFLFTPAHYLNPGWKIEGDTGAQPVE